MEWLEQEHLWSLGGRVSLPWSWCCLLNLKEVWFQASPLYFSILNIIQFPSQPPHSHALAILAPQAPPRPQTFPAPFPLPVQEPSALNVWSCWPMRRYCGKGLYPPRHGGHSPLPGIGFWPSAIPGCGWAPPPGKLGGWGKGLVRVSPAEEANSKPRPMLAQAATHCVGLGLNR